MKNQTKKIIIAAVGVVVLAAVMLCCYFAFAPKGAAGDKTITAEVVFEDGTQNSYIIETSEEYLRGALEQQKLIEGEESSYGLFITSVDGVKADDSKQQWWCITKSGETVNTGVDTTPIADGDKFELTLTTGY